MLDPSVFTYEEIVERCSATTAGYRKRFGAEGLTLLDRNLARPPTIFITHIRAIAGHPKTSQEEERGVPSEAVMSWVKLPSRWSTYLYH